MRNKLLFIACLVLALAISAVSKDIDGQTSLGVRFPIFIPLDNGDNFAIASKNHQPFMMGWDFGLEARRGISRKVMLGLTGNYLSTHDDTSRMDNAGDDFNDKNHATAKLTGVAFGFNGYWFYQPDWKLQPYWLAGVGLDFWKVKKIAAGESHSATDFNFKVGTGVLVPVSEKLTLDLQVKLTRELSNLSNSFKAGDYGPETWDKFDNRPFGGYLELSLGLTRLFGAEVDSDHDGVKDSKDKCPGTPAGVAVDKLGCPIDTDGDGVADYLDKCANTPAGVPVDSKGCPRDNDNDGVADYLDKCPNSPSGAKVDATGCSSDSDNDGVVDEKDKCPNSPANAKVDATGCPLDTDGDGVADYMDKCAGTPAGIPVDETGCPTLAKKGAKLTLHVNFPTNSYEIDAESKKILDGVAQTMTSFPDIKIRIAGFTDDRGSSSHNKLLSENRAAAVAKYLEGQGVAKGRVGYVGRGEDPKYFVGDNATDEGRAKNRRVELESIE